MDHYSSVTTHTTEGIKMETITIVVEGEELEQINVELSKEEVSAIYKQRKEQAKKIIELEKKLSDSEKSKKYSDDNLSVAKNELDQAHTLLTALGIQDKTNHEESYYRKDLNVSTRIALYIARQSN